MSGGYMHTPGETRFEARSATRDSALVKGTILTLGLGFFLLFLVLPLIVVFAEALRKGWETYLAALVEPDALSAIKLTLIAALIAVPLNVVCSAFRPLGRLPSSSFAAKPFSPPSSTCRFPSPR
jgi:ABC-type sulfate transport system permease subunit